MNTVIQVNGLLIFDNGMVLDSKHNQDSYESHYLSFDDLSLDDFEGLEFDLSNDNFFERIAGYGIALLPVNGWPVRVPGYGYNNGYYSCDINLVLTDAGGNIIKSYDVTECQNSVDEWGDPTPS